MTVAVVNYGIGHGKHTAHLPIPTGTSDYDATTIVQQFVEQRLEWEWDWMPSDVLAAVSNDTIDLLDADPAKDRGATLLNCPFCGSQPTNNRYQDYDHGRREEGWLVSTIGCPNCEVEFTYWTEAQAAAAWNTRAPACEVSS